MTLLWPLLYLGHRPNSLTSDSLTVAVQYEKEMRVDCEFTVERSETLKKINYALMRIGGYCLSNTGVAIDEI